MEITEITTKSLDEELAEAATGESADAEDEVYAEEPYTDVSTLTLTPMQEQLLQLFLESPERTLCKDRICSALWPKKDNPDDTFYTFISRMKSALAKQSTLKIENKRGGGYVLYDESKENAL